jgi:hypothetical protein
MEVTLEVLFLNGKERKKEKKKGGGGIWRLAIAPFITMNMIKT